MQTIKPEAINKWTSLSNQAVKGTSVNAEEIIRLLLLESSLGLFRNPNPNIFQGKFGDITGLEKKTWEDFTKRNPELAKAANFNTIEGTLKASALVMADKKEKKNIEYSEPKKLKNGKTVFMKKTTKPSVMQNEQDTYTSYTGQTNPKEKAEKIARWKLADDYFDNIEEQKLQALNSED